MPLPHSKMNILVQRTRTLYYRFRPIQWNHGQLQFPKKMICTRLPHERKKLKSTTKYIYDTLFVNGENSDVKIIALGREWPLHKIYLCQSGYFSSMFSGSWKESALSTIDMSIPDNNIDEEALEIAFGSLYRDDVLIRPATVVNILAAATLLQLDGLIHQCADIMKETISSKTVCHYHSASVTYGLSYVIKKCTEWLQKNLMVCQSASLLRDISPELMQKLISSADLYVMQVEMDIYTMLKKWMFLQLMPSWNGGTKRLSAEADTYYKKQLEGADCNFLESERGQDFACVFQCLRFHHVINDLPSANLIHNDRIIPERWLLPFYKTQWYYMLRVEQGLDKGPVDVDEAEFGRLAMRCGRILLKDTEYCWRWTGLNYGVDLLVTFTKRLLIFKRNTQSQTCNSFVSMTSKRNIVFRVTVSSFDPCGQTRYVKSSGLRHLAMGKDEEQVIMGVDRHLVFPLHISLNILYYTPTDELPLPSITLLPTSTKISDDSELVTSRTEPHQESSSKHKDDAVINKSSTDAKENNLNADIDELNTELENT